MTIFRYTYRPTPLHHLDARVKLAALLLLGLLMGFTANWMLCGLLAAGAAICVGISKLPIKPLLLDLRFFAVIMAFAFASYALSVPGDTLLQAGFLHVSFQGVNAGLLFCARLTVVVLFCATVTGTTSPMEFRDAVEWFAKPIPFVNERKLAMMVNLTLGLIPVVFDCWHETMDAQKARCVETRKNPVDRLVLCVRPLMEILFLKADEMVLAMQARGYDEEP